MNWVSSKPLSEVNLGFCLGSAWGNCSSRSNRIGSTRIGDLNTSKAKLRGAKYQREKTKTRRFS